MHRLFGLIVGSAALCCWAAAGHAQQLGGKRGPFIGVSVGSFGYDQGSKGPFGAEFSDSGSAYRLFTGYQFNNVYSVELGWEATGDFKQTFTILIPPPPAAPTQLGLADLTTDYRLATLRLLAFAPLSSAMHMFGGIGVYDAKVDANVEYKDAPNHVFGRASDDRRGTGATVIGGVEFDLRKISIRGEYEWFHTKNLPDARSFNVGVVYIF